MTDVFYTLKKRDKHGFHIRLHSFASQSLCAVVLVLSMFSSAVAADESDRGPDSAEMSVDALIKEVRSVVLKRKYKWDTSVFSGSGLIVNGYSVAKRPLTYFTCGDKSAPNSALILSTVHGDEVNPLYFGFRIIEWLRANPELCKDSHIVVAPLVNPDGALRYSNGTRTNYNKIDVNRNFDTPDFAPLAMKLWKEKYRSRRYYPGEKGGSEPETKFQKWLIDEFKPNKILSIHAPLNGLDYDGPKVPGPDFTKSYVDSCEQLKSAMKKATPSLNFFTYGVFPGSLGNYAGKHRGIPTFTVELPDIDPSNAGKYFGELEVSTRLFITQPVTQKQASTE